MIYTQSRHAIGTGQGSIGLQFLNCLTNPIGRSSQNYGSFHQPFHKGDFKAARSYLHVEMDSSKIVYENSLLGPLIERREEELFQSMPIKRHRAEIRKDNE